LRLTKTLRDSFISRVLADVPQKDYSELIRSAVVKAARDALPLQIKELLNDETLSKHVLQSYVTVGVGCGLSVAVHGAFKSEYRSREGYVLPTELDTEEVRILIKEEKAQAAKLASLKSQLHAAVYGANTTLQLRELFPKFAKYLPTEVATSVDRSLPVVTGVLDAFVAAGWPKQR